MKDWGKCTCVGKKKGENGTFYVKFKNFESMTKISHCKKSHGEV